VDGDTRIFTWKTLQKTKVKTTGPSVQKILPLFYSRITNATPLANLEAILSMSHLLRWYTKILSPNFGGTLSHQFPVASRSSVYHLIVLYLQKKNIPVFIRLQSSFLPRNYLMLKLR